jgi:hypothetical protein
MTCQCNAAPVRTFVASACLFALAASCGGSTTGELLPTPFPGSVISAEQAGRCTSSHCMVTYRVRIMNPTPGDANVQDCLVLPAVPGLVRLPIMGIAGLGIPAGATRTITARFLLPIGRSGVDGLAGRQLACTGIDWHGSPPV